MRRCMTAVRARHVTATLPRGARALSRDVRGAVARAVAAALCLGAADCDARDLVALPRTPLGVAIGALRVAPVYPLHGRGWNDHVVRQDAGASPLDQADVACGPDQRHGTFRDCAHAGELRRVEVPGLWSCDGLTLSDDLGAFAWRCDLLDGRVVFRSTGLRSDMGLRDLVTAQGFVPNRVRLRYLDEEIARSPTAAWWGNSVLPLPDNSGAEDSAVALDQPGTIYVLEQSRESQGYRLEAERLAVVMRPGVELGARDDIKPNCYEINDSYSTACLVSSRRAFSGEDEPPYSWIEGALDGGVAEHTLVLGGVFCTAKHLRVVGGGIPIDGADETGSFDLRARACTLSDVAATQSRSSGISLRAGGHLVERLRVISNRAHGLFLEYPTSRESHFRDVIAANNGRSGILVEGSDNLFFDVVASNNGLHGVDLFRDRNTLIRAALFNNGQHGLSMWRGGNAVLGLLAASNTGSGINMGRSNGSASAIHAVVLINNVAGLTFLQATTSAPDQLSDLVVAYSDVGISVGAGNLNGRLSGTVTLTANGVDCAVAADATDGPVVDGDCTLGTESDAVLIRDAAVAPRMVAALAGKATSDPVNRSAAAAGTADAGAITDWTGFGRSLRGWGRDGGVFPDPSQRGRCESGTCRIWDWHLAPGPSPLRDAHGLFSPGQGCPEAAGVEILQTFLGRRYLANAVELVDAPAGDGDGMCDGGETCSFLPNLGADQFQDQRLAELPCLLAGGQVSGVTLHGVDTR